MRIKIINAKSTDDFFCLLNKTTGYFNEDYACFGVYVREIDKTFYIPKAYCMLVNDGEKLHNRFFGVKIISCNSVDYDYSYLIGKNLLCRRTDKSGSFILNLSNQDVILLKNDAIIVSDIDMNYYYRQLILKLCS